MNRICRYAVCMIALIFATDAYSASYYISTLGNDADVGSETFPWRNPWIIRSKTFSPGDTVYVKAGTYTMTHQAWNDYDAANVCFLQSGTAGNPITFRNYGTDVVEFDNNGGTGEFPVLGACGAVSWIVWEGIKLSDIGRRGMVLYNSTNIVVSSIEITQLPNICTTCVCDNTPMLRIEGSSYITVRNSYFHDHESSCNDGNATALQVYDSDHNLYENNTIHNVAAGITHKGIASQNHYHTARYNYIYNTSVEGIRFGGQDNATLTNNTIHHNVLVNTGYGIDLKDTTVGMYHTNLSIYNNTVYQFTNYCIQFPRAGANSTGYSFYNNACVDDGVNVMDYGSKDENTPTTDPSLIAVVHDYNIFYSPSLALQCNRGGTTYTSLAAWQANCHGYDVHSSSVEPTFVNVNDGPTGFRVTTGSAYQAGKTGGVSGGTTVNIGAYELGTETIGRTTGVDTTPPAAPTGVVISYNLLGVTP